MPLYTFTPKIKKKRIYMGLKSEAHFFSFSHNQALRRRLSYIVERVRSLAAAGFGISEQRRQEECAWKRRGQASRTTSQAHPRPQHSPAAGTRTLPSPTERGRCPPSTRFSEVQLLVFMVQHLATRGHLEALNRRKFTRESWSLIFQKYFFFLHQVLIHVRYTR